MHTCYTVNCKEMKDNTFYFVLVAGFVEGAGY